MAQWYRAFATIPHDNGLPVDAVTNSFAFMVAGSADRDLVAVDIDGRLTSFYSALSGWISSQMNTDGATVKVYDMLEDQPRYPYYEAPLTITSAAATPNDMPSEVALVLSFQGARESGANMRRRRGRIYFGPLQLPSTSDYQLASSTLRDLLATTAGTYLLNPTAPAGLSDWAVYSGYTHRAIPVGERFTNDEEWPEVPDALPSAFTPVATCWVDNAWDTQRRRGVSATARTTILAS